MRDKECFCVFYMLDKFKYRDSYVDVSFLLINDSSVKNYCVCCCSSFHLETSSWDEFIEDASEFSIDLVAQLLLNSNGVEDVWVLGL